MKLEKLKAHRRRSRWLDGFFWKNPIFMGGLALPFAILSTTTLKSALAISTAISCSLVATVLLSQIIGRLFPKMICFCVYAVFSMGIIVGCSPIINLLSPDLLDSLGIYVPIAAVNSIVTLLCSRSFESGYGPFRALADSVVYSLGATMALCIIGAVRELLGVNMIWGVSVELPIRMSGFQIAFAGFLVTAFGSAVFHVIRRIVLLAHYRRENPLAREEDLS